MLIDEMRYHRRRTMGLGLVAVVIVFIMWNVPQLSFILYPFRLFVTYVHEAGHGIAAVLTGGELRSLQVFSNGAGQALTAGGIRAVILPAGYLGAAMFGAILFYAINRFHQSRAISIGLGIVLIVFSVLFARLSPTALVIGGLFGISLIMLGWKINGALNTIMLTVLAIVTGLNAVLDLYYLSVNSGIMAGQGNIRNDAAAFSQEVFPLVPPTIWALIWAILAAVMLGASVWFSVLRPMQEEILEVVKRDTRDYEDFSQYT